MGKVSVELPLSSTSTPRHSPASIPNSIVGSNTFQADNTKRSRDLLELGGSRHMAVSAAAEERAVGVCSQTICSSGSGLVSQLEDFLMEVSPQGATLQNTHGGIGLASKAPEEKAWPVFLAPLHQICLPIN